MAAVPAAPTPARAGRALVGLVALVGTAALLYLPLVGYRWDYLGHFATGAGLALGAIVLGHRLRGPTALVPPAAAAGVITIGIIGEALWFSHLFFDWADVGAGGLGAALVAAWAVGEDRDELPWGPFVALAVVLVLAGVALRFGFDEVGAVR